LKPYFRPSVVLLAVFLGLLWGCKIACAKDKSAIMLFPSSGSKKTPEKTDKALPEIPANLDREKINEIVAGLSDDQVRKLLIRKLELAAAAAASAKKQTAPEASGVARVAQIAERNINAFHKRLKEIRSGAVAVPNFFPKAYADLRGQGGTSNILFMFAGVFALLASGLGAEWLFGRYAADMRTRLSAASPPAHWTVKLKRLLLFALIDFISICVFSLATLVVFFLFFNLGAGARLVLMIFLVVVLMVRGIGLLLSFFLAPRASGLRLPLLEDKTAIHLYRCIMGLVLFLGISFLIRGLLELQGISEETVLFLRAFNAAVILCVIVYLMFNNREAVACMIRRGTPDAATGINLLRAQLASFWHLLALPYLVLVWGLWVFYLMVRRDDLVIPVLALLSSLPLFLVLDWLGQRLLSVLFGLVDRQQTLEPGPEVEGSDEETTVEPTPDQKAGPAVPHVSRFVPIFRRCLSLSIAGVIFFWLLDLWGFEVQFGEQFTGAAIKIILIVTIAYVAWRLIEDAFKRKISEAQGKLQVDEDADAGGEGGSRVGTLLELFRKFLLVLLWVTVGLIILSAMGINITPLLAGASILGLAIGLGTQNLIKDIVSGLFFLIDDAFRIGDYVESGAVKGTVEAISIRSLKLRSTRGMVLNVPFSQLGSVTNFSRDYNIAKLDFRVPFDTDVDQVRKVVKKIDKEIQQDEELGLNLLGPIKSAGVMSFDDSALIMRVKFKCKPGLQFVIQRQVFKRLKELFDEKGLEFATRHVNVRLPDEPAQGKQ